MQNPSTLLFIRYNSIHLAFAMAVALYFCSVVSDLLGEPCNGLVPSHSLRQ